MKKRTLRNSSTKNISRFVSIKTDSIHTVESDLEFDACFHFEFALQILLYEAQPLGFEYMLNGNFHEYTPDFICLFADGRQTYYEVKPKHDTQLSEFQEAFEAQRQHARDEMGRGLKVLTEDDIQVYPLLNNLKVIHRYASNQKVNALQRNILSQFKQNSELRIHQIIDGSQDTSAHVLPAIYDLIAKRLLQFDWHEPLGWETTVMEGNCLENHLTSSEDLDDMSNFFPVTQNTSKPKETKSLPIWEEVQESYTDIFAFDEDRREEAIHRYNIIDALVDLHGPELSFKKIEESKSYLEDKFKPHVPAPISIYRYWRAFTKSGFELSSLVPQITKGNTTKRVSEELEEYIEQAINNYFSDEEQTMQMAYTELETEILRHNECHETQLKLFSIQAFRKRIRRLPEYEQLVLQKGKAQADAFYRKVGQKPT